MARTVNPEEHTLRRNEILDAAQQLIYTRGYEQMTIQDILDQTAISKGAFYHYFDSKPALLEALVARMEDELSLILTPIVDDPRLSALEKMERYFDAGARWKAARKPYMIELMRVWYSDENSIVRQKMLAAGVAWVTPALAKIVRQGIAEGVFNTPYPDQIGVIVAALSSSLGDTVARLILSPPGGPEQERLMRAAEEAIAAHNHAITRVLGAAPGALKMIDPAILREWVPVKNEE